MTISPDGNIIASGSEDQTIKLWDVNIGECLKTLKGQTSWIRTVAFSPDGQFLASAGENPIVELWDIRTKLIYQAIESTKTLRRYGYHGCYSSYRSTNQYSKNVRSLQKR